MNTAIFAYVTSSFSWFFGWELGTRLPTVIQPPWCNINTGAPARSFQEVARGHQNICPSCFMTTAFCILWIHTVVI